MKSKWIYASKAYVSDFRNIGKRFMRNGCGMKIDWKWRCMKTLCNTKQWFHFIIQQLAEFRLNCKLIWGLFFFEIFSYQPELNSFVIDGQAVRAHRQTYTTIQCVKSQTMCYALILHYFSRLFHGLTFT